VLRTIRTVTVPAILDQEVIRSRRPGANNPYASHQEQREQERHTQRHNREAPEMGDKVEDPAPTLPLFRLGVDQLPSEPPNDDQQDEVDDRPAQGHDRVSEVEIGVEPEEPGPGLGYKPYGKPRAQSGSRPEREERDQRDP